jgi:hypothetical protein
MPAGPFEGTHVTARRIDLPVAGIVAFSGTPTTSSPLKSEDPSLQAFGGGSGFTIAAIGEKGRSNDSPGVDDVLLFSSDP